MIISPPFLTARSDNQTDADYVAACMTGDTPGSGSYPVSHRLNWHGGLHLEAPAGTTGRLPVRAIADGTVVLVRQPTAMPVDARTRQQLALGYYRGWTDNGVVVIRHETEIGEGSSAQVTFFSVYQHLHTIRPAVRQGQRVYRKAELGQAGYIYGEPDRIQLEIVCDDVNLRRLVGRADGDVPLSTDGRTESVYGELYFALPAGTEVFDRSPHASEQAASAVPTPSVVHTMAEPLFVGVRYASGDATLTSYTAMGTVVGTPRTDSDYEYNLYREATRIYPNCPSAGYELLRFGRVLGPDNLNPAGAAHWRQIRYADGEGWVNLNATGIRQFSDADFPHWRGWFLIDDAQDTNSRCDSATIIRALDIDSDGTVTCEEAERRLPTAPMRAFMKRLVCKFPTEWDAATIDARWDWIQQGNGNAVTGTGSLLATEAGSLTAADFDRLRAHLDELSFWDAGEIGIDGSHWHFDPREFITNFRQCRWLSAHELALIYPDRNYPQTALATEARGRTPATIREQYRSEINKVARKYFIETPTRMTHFYGQGAVESLLLTLMVEGSANFSRNPRHASFQPENNGYYIPSNRNDYLFYLEGRLGNVDNGDGPKFRGRGMKQLTGRENYSKYWVYRGWLDASSFDSGWWRDTQRLRPPAINNPQALSTNTYNCIDAGGWYWEAGAARARYRSINRVITEDDVSNAAVERVTRAINGGVNGLAQRIAHTQRIDSVLNDNPA